MVAAAMSAAVAYCPSMEEGLELLPDIDGSEEKIDGSDYHISESLKPCTAEN
jgi:hypothetical protein